MSSPAAPEQRVAPDKVLTIDLRWEADPAHRLWLRASYEGGWLHLRVNPTFPDDPLYSLLVAENETYDFDDLPDTWERVGDLMWPEQEL